MEALTERKPSLSDPEYAAFAWARYRRLMRWMSLVALIAILLALIYLRIEVGSLPLAMTIATIAGVGLTVLLGTGLMGLIFLSSGTGYDEDVKKLGDDAE